MECPSAARVGARYFLCSLSRLRGRPPRRRGELLGWIPARVGDDPRELGIHPVRDTGRAGVQSAIVTRCRSRKCRYREALVFEELGCVAVLVDGVFDICTIKVVQAVKKFIKGGRFGP